MKQVKAEVELISYTQDAAELLILSKNTRHFSSSKSLDDIKNMLPEEKEKQLKYVFGTIGSSWEFVNYVFMIRNVSRGFTHQLVRSRHASFAQQSLRVVDASGFDYIAENTVDDFKPYEMVMENISENYNSLIRAGINIQDARGILPTNISTNIMFSANLRTISDMISMRSCIRTQGEYRAVIDKIKSSILSIHPWTESIFDVYCIRHNKCPWDNFDECPMKSSFPHLSGQNESEYSVMKSFFDKMKSIDFQPEIKR
jgi:flavin-dependent thymidylate synthase